MRRLLKMAEEKLSDRSAGPASGRAPGIQAVQTSRREANRLVHELRVYQSALDMQNEELRCAQVEAEESGQNYRELYETVPVACYTLDARGTVLDVNQDGATLLHSAPRHVLGRRLSIFLCESDRAIFTGFLRKVLKGLGQEFCTVRLADDETMALALIGSKGGLNERKMPVVRLAVMDVTSFIRMQGALHQANEALEATVNERTAQLSAAIAEQKREMAERKQREQELAEQRRLYKSVTDNAALSLFIVDESQQCVFMNPAAEALTGFALAEVMGRPLHDVLHHTRPDGSPYPAGECPIDQAFPKNDREQGEEVFVHKDGRFYNVAFTASPIRNELGQPVGTVIEVQDITERKRAEAMLRESEERFRLIFQYAGTGIAMTDLEGRFVQSNPAYREMVGYTEEELRRLSFPSLIHPDDREDNMKAVQALLDKKQSSFVIENRYVHKSGQPVWVRKYVSILYGNTGEPTHFIALVSDITERKAYEASLLRLNESLEQRVKERTAALAESNERWDWVTRATHDGVWDWDLLHDTVYFSPRWKEMHGFQEGDLSESSKEWTARIHPEDRQRVMDHLEAYLAGRRHEFWEEYRIQRKDGSYFWVLDRGIAIWNEQGQAVRMVGAETDITWRKQAEETLRRREEDFHALADNVPALFSYIDKEHRYRFVNSRYEELFGHPDEAIVGLSVRDLLGPDGYAEVQPYLGKALAGEPVSFEYQLRIPGASAHHFSAQYVPDRDAQGQVEGLFVLLADVTALKLSESALREREAELRDLSAKLLWVQEDERRRIARDLHDDVTQRLAALSLELYAMGQDAVHMGCDPSLASRVRELGASTERLTTDVQEMAHRLHPSILEHVGLEAAAREQVDEFAVRTGLATEFMARNVPRDVSMDRATCLYRVLQESLQNVCKHAKATNVLVRLLNNRRGIGLCVHDDGRGFDCQESAGPRKGLGLSSMAERVRLLNGRFRVKSKPGDGTEIHAWLPLGDVNPSP